MEEKRKSLAEIPAPKGDPSFKKGRKTIKYIFYPEDVEKMEGMDIIDEMEYKGQLIAEGKCMKIVKTNHD